VDEVLREQPLDRVEVAFVDRLTVEAADQLFVTGEIAQAPQTKGAAPRIASIADRF